MERFGNLVISILVFILLLASSTNLNQLLLHLSNRFRFIHQEGQEYDCLLILTKQGGFETVDRQLKANISAFNSKYRDVSHCTINSKRFLFISDRILYSSHPRLNLMSIHQVPFPLPITSVAMGEDHIVVVDIEGRVHYAESGFHFKSFLLSFFHI